MEETNFWGILITIILLNVAMVFGYKSVIVNMKETILSSEETLEDKNVKYVKGNEKDIYNENIKDMNRLKVLLTTQVQDYEMPEPKSLTIDGTKINITSMYQVDLITYANNTWNEIKNDDEEQVYNIKYNFGTWGTNNSTYKVVRKG